MQRVSRLPLLFARCGVELELALLRLGERLEAEVALAVGLLAELVRVSIRVRVRVSVSVWVSVWVSVSALEEA